MIFYILDTNVGDEGGFAPDLCSVEECLDLLVETIETCKYTGKVSIALDVAASGNECRNIRTFNLFLEFHLESKPGFYDLDIKKSDQNNHRILSGDEMVSYYLSLIEKYPSKKFKRYFIFQTF